MKLRVNWQRNKGLAEKMLATAHLGLCIMENAYR